MVKKVVDKGNESIRYYKFSYLIKHLGGKKLFSPGRDKWLYIAIALAIIAGVFGRYNLIKHPSISEFFDVSTVGGITLFGLVIASFAIATSINNDKLLETLIKSRYYAYAIFSFTWATLWSLITGVVGVFAIIFSLQNILFPFEVFFIFYALFESFVSIFFILRHIAIMSARYTPELKKAWDEFERNNK